MNKRMLVEAIHRCGEKKIQVWHTQYIHINAHMSYKN